MGNTIEEKETQRISSASTKNKKPCKQHSENRAKLTAKRHHKVEKD